MRTTSNKQQLLTVFQTLTDFMADMPETMSNIRKFKRMLKALGPDIDMLLKYQSDTQIANSNPSGILNMTLASRAFYDEKLKMRFLQCILDIAPKQLIIEFHTDSPGEILQLLTPLRISIKNRSVDMVNAVMNHPIFTTYMNNRVEHCCDQLFRAYMWALCWYDETGTVLDLWTNLVEQERTWTWGKCLATLANQQEILDILLEHCKAAMVIASPQKQTMLPKQIIQTFLFDRIAGESFTSNKPYLLKIQASKIVEICKAYYRTPQELEVAITMGHLLSVETIIQLVNLRLTVLEAETDENIQKFKESLNQLSTHLGHALFTEFLSLTGRSCPSNNLCKVTLHKFALDNEKHKFAKCISKAEAASIEVKKRAVEASRLQQHVTPAKASVVVLSTAAAPATGMLNLEAIINDIYTLSLTSKKTTIAINEAKEPGRGK